MYHRMIVTWISVNIFPLIVVRLKKRLSISLKIIQEFLSTTQLLCLLSIGDLSPLMF